MTDLVGQISSPDPLKKEHTNSRTPRNVHSHGSGNLEGWEELGSDSD